MMKAVWVVICGIALAGTLSAQVEAKGQIRGVIVDHSGAVMPNTTVLVIDLNTLLTHRVTTEREGEFRFEDLPLLHDYMLVTRYRCFKPKILRKVKAGSGKPLRIKLEFGGNEGCTAVTVTSASPCLRGEIGVWLKADSWQPGGFLAALGIRTKTAFLPYNLT